MDKTRPRVKSTPKKVSSLTVPQCDLNNEPILGLHYFFGLKWFLRNSLILRSDLKDGSKNGHHVNSDFASTSIQQEKWRSGAHNSGGWS
jgi:hypothetical protein